MASSNSLPSFKRQAATNTSIAELQRLAGITLASMEAVRGTVEGPERSDLLTELRMTERAERFAAKVGDRVRGSSSGDEGSIVALEPHHTGRGQTLVVKFDNGKQMKMSPGDVTFLRSESDPFDPPDDPPQYYRYTFSFYSDADAEKGRKIIEQTYGNIDDPEIEGEMVQFTAYGWGDSDTDGRHVDEDLTKAGIEHAFDEIEEEPPSREPEYRKDEGRKSMRRLANLQERVAAASRTGASRAYDLGRDTADAHSDDWTSSSFSQGDLRRTAEEQSDEEIQHGNITRAEKKQFIAGYIDGVNTARGEKTGAVTERATRKGADPKWMTMAIRIAGISNEVMDFLGIEQYPAKGSTAMEAIRTGFLTKVENEYGPPRKQIPIEVYYEFEDANYHTPNEWLQDAGYFDAPYGERRDQYEKEREGIKPMWNR